MDMANVEELVKALNISPKFGEILKARGFDDIEEARAFLYPSIDNMTNPLDIKGMKEAADRVKVAIKKQEKILVFGDYDCDGISAISILMLYLRDKVPVDFYIPNRNVDGYGLSSIAIESILEKNKPSLVITVDCGITSVTEIQYLKEHGIDAIVTDHHEPQDKLPDCIVVDPKIEKKGFYDFCGAGVALKLVEALSSREEATKYFDICALATLADLVPLLGENRIIAYYGLKQIEKKPRLGIKYLLGQDKISSYEVMFRLAPRINSAGRLNSAMKVVDLFISEDPILLKMLVEELENDNSKRQAICEQVVSEAREMLKGVDFNATRIIILEKDDWESGVIGIAASRLVDEFKRPTVLLAKKEDGLLRGSSRSIKSVNIFDLLTRLQDCFEAYGGHAQAAGITMQQDRLEEFKKRANTILIEEHEDEEFASKFKYDADLDMNSNLLEFAMELELLEPTGFANPKPSFRIIGNGLKFERIGFSNHIKFHKQDFEIIGFSCLNKLGSLSGVVELEVSLARNIYQNREYAQGTIKNIRVDSINLDDKESQLLNIHQLENKEDTVLPKISIKAIDEILEKPYGTLFICFSKEEFEKLKKEIKGLNKCSVSVGEPMTSNPENSILICPKKGMDFSFFERVIVAGNPLCTKYLSYIASHCKEAFSLEDYNGERVVIVDDVIDAIYTEIKRGDLSGIRFFSHTNMYNYIKKKVSISYFGFCVVFQILSELGIVTFNERGKLELVYKKTNRNMSQTYINTRP